MAKVVKFLSPYQLAILLKSWENEESYQSVLEDMIDKCDPVAMYIDTELQKFGYGSWEDEESYGFSTPPTRILTKIISKIMKGGKEFIPVEETLIHRIPQPPKKWRWRMVDKCHRHWGWVA